MTTNQLQFSLQLRSLNSFDLGHNDRDASRLAGICVVYDRTSQGWFSTMKATAGRHMGDIGKSRAIIQWHLLGGDTKHTLLPPHQQI